MFRQKDHTSLLIFLLFSLAASEAVARQRQAVAVLPLKTESVRMKTVRILDSFILAGVSELAGYRVVSPADVNAVLGLEQTKDAMGCSDVTCAAEIGGALGVDYLFVGTVDILGGSILLTGSLLDIRNAEAVARKKVMAPNNEDQYLEAAHDLVRAVFADARIVSERSSVASRESEPVVRSTTWGNEARAILESGGDEMPVLDAQPGDNGVLVGGGIAYDGLDLVWLALNATLLRERWYLGGSVDVLTGPLAVRFWVDLGGRLKVNEHFFVGGGATAGLVAYPFTVATAGLQVQAGVTFAERFQLCVSGRLAIDSTYATIDPTARMVFGVVL